MKVIKRDGRIVDFDRRRIKNAISKSGGDPQLWKDVHSGLLNRQKDVVSVEEIQDIVEEILISFEEADVAKRYILYRYQHAALRDVHPDPNAIGDFVSSSKYSRVKYSAEDPYRETWEDSVKRLYGMHRRKFNKEYESSEVFKNLFEKSFQAIKDKRVLPAMRSMQFGGIAAELKNERMYNCWYSACNRIDFFHQAFYLLLCGGGTGFSVQTHHIKKLKQDLYTEEFFVPSRKRINYHTIEDTIEGWVDALKVLVGSYLRPFEDYVEFDYSKIRPLGSELVTSGGIAPGHVDLKLMLENLRNIFVGDITSIKIFDAVCIIANCVKAGGVRRSSLICLFSSTDLEMIKSKTSDTWFKKYPYRAMCNISAVYERNKLTESDISSLLVASKNYGEPGFYVTEDLNWGTNPCAEIGLDPPEDAWACCNLSEINAAKANSEEEFIELAEYATFLGTLQAAYTDFNVEILGDATVDHVKDRALLGVSITGIEDCPTELSALLLQRTALKVLELNSQVAAQIGINPAKRLTTIKPSGTASLVLGCVGSGIHPHHSKRYFRNVLASKEEAVLKEFRKVNPHMVKDISETDCLVTFPVEARSKTNRESYSAEDMFDRAMFFYKHWIIPGSKSILTHNVSATITVKDHEWIAMVKKITENRDHICAMSFLPFTGDTAYKNAPRVAVETEEDISRWKSLISNYKPVDYTKAVDGITDFGAACEGVNCELPRDRL